MNDLERIAELDHIVGDLEVHLDATQDTLSVLAAAVRDHATVHGTLSRVHVCLATLLGEAHRARVLLAELQRSPGRAAQPRDGKMAAANDDSLKEVAA